MFKSKNQKILWKYFAVLLAINLVIFNWGYITWFFNYNTIGENISYLAKKIIGQNDLSLNVSFTSTTLTQSQSNQSGYLAISSIEVKAPIMFTTSRSQNVFSALLKKGVLHFSESALPGTLGTTIILGHSSPSNWPKINYDRVFNDLEKLKPNSEILVSFQDKDYKYKVKRIYWVNKGENLSPGLTFNKSMLLLVSCWPPGHNLKRIVVEAELQ
ncbi:MAG: sortase [Candidatus Pacebacteria bacterium]|nr:sortase [Candidatus Paceibacterota bacterium]